MPYSGADDPKLPKNVKAVKDAKIRRQWTHVFNGELDKHGDEARAFASANSVLDKAKAKKDWDDEYIPYSITSRQVSQADANYNPVGMIEDGDSKGCANCQWFISPDRCVLVQGDISPTGDSKFWTKAIPYTPTPMPVVMMEADDNEDSDEPTTFGKGATGSFIKTVVDAVKSFVAPSEALSWEETTIYSNDNSGMKFFKAKDGSVRFLATVTNNFQDRQQEIITEEAHKEFIAWADETGKYPELWLWHSGAKSRWGQADWLDYSDGFLVASGTVDAGKEGIANSFRGGEDVAVSHGFLSQKSLDGTITKYRMFELSPLPRWAAANEWTAFHIGVGDDVGMVGEDMAFTKDKRDWLMARGVPETAISGYEKSVATLDQDLKARGIDFKDLAGVGAASAISGSAPKTPPSLVHSGATTDEKAKITAKKPADTDNDPEDKNEGPETGKEDAEDVAEAKKKKKEAVVGSGDAITEGFKALGDKLDTLIGVLTVKVQADATATEAATKAATPPPVVKTKEEEFMEMWKSQASDAMGGHRASESNGNVVSEKQRTEDQDWFKTTVIGGLIGSDVAGGSN